MKPRSRMLDIVPGVQKAPNHAAMRAMFAARKHVFVDLLKWNLPILEGMFEIDQFDNPDAQYLILLDRKGRHRASARLLPTDQPHLLGDLYPYLCDGPVPRGPNIWEVTRFCLDRNQTSAERRSARNQLVTALADHALRTGITDYTGVAELRWLNQVLRFGWQCAPLGLPVAEEGRMLASLLIHIDEHTIDGLKRTGVHEPLALHMAGTEEYVS